VLGGLAYVGMSKVRQDARLTSLSPDPDHAPEPVRETTS